MNLQAASGVQYVHDGRVSAHYFDVLALHPLMGRNFSEDEDRPHGAKVAILTYKLWRNLLGGERGILGQTILLKGEPYTVVGVLPQAITTPLNADLYTALQPSREGEGSGTNFDVSPGCAMARPGRRRMRRSTGLGLCVHSAMPK